MDTDETPIAPCGRRHPDPLMGPCRLCEKIAALDRSRYPAPGHIGIEITKVERSTREESCGDMLRRLGAIDVLKRDLEIAKRGRAAFVEHSRRVEAAGNANASAALLGDREIAELQQQIKVESSARAAFAEAVALISTIVDAEDVTVSELPRVVAAKITYATKLAETHAERAALLRDDLASARAGWDRDVEDAQAMHRRTLDELAARAGLATGLSFEEFGDALREMATRGAFILEIAELLGYDARGVDVDLPFPRKMIKQLIKEGRADASLVDRDTLVDGFRQWRGQLAEALKIDAATPLEVVLDVIRSLVQAKPWAPDYGRAIAQALGFAEPMSWADALKAITAIRRRLDEARPGLERLGLLEERVKVLENATGVRRLAPGAPVAEADLPF